MTRDERHGIGPTNERVALGDATAWELFFDQAVRAALASGNRVLDVGASLRVDPTRGNRVDPARTRFRPLLAGVRYDVVDPVATYNPTVVGDLHGLPFCDGSYDAIVCLAVLEHVRRPWDAAREMLRVLKAGGLLVLYVPFLLTYHAEPGYYSDYWRFTDEGVLALLEDFERVTLQAVRGPAETVAHMLPRGMPVKPLEKAARVADRVRRGSGKQTSGFFATAHKPADS